MEVLFTAATFGMIVTIKVPGKRASIPIKWERFFAMDRLQFFRYVFDEISAKREEKNEFFRMQLNDNRS
jgi:hypothetical protein